MRITFDPQKREVTLQERGLDFNDATEVFAGPTLTVLDTRREYEGEDRYRTYGYLRGRMVKLAWTPRGTARRVFPMRKCNAREQARYRERLGETGRDDR